MKDRKFKGVWIPREIWLSKDLSITEKCLLVEIDSLDNDDGCFASNKYFGEFFGVSDRQISKYVSQLQKKGYIKVTIINRTKRSIRIEQKFVPGTNKSSNQVRTKVLHNNKGNNKENNKERSAKETFAPTTVKSVDLVVMVKDSIVPGFRDSLIAEGFPAAEVDSEFREFISYWQEKSPRGRKMRWEKEKVFDVNRRLRTWFKNSRKWKKDSGNKYKITSI